MLTAFHCTASTLFCFQVLNCAWLHSSTVLTRDLKVSSPSPFHFLSNGVNLQHWSWVWHFQFSTVFRVRLWVDFLTLTLMKSLGSTPNTYPNPRPRFHILGLNCRFTNNSIRAHCRCLQKEDRSVTLADQFTQFWLVRPGSCKDRTNDREGSKNDDTFSLLKDNTYFLL